MSNPVQRLPPFTNADFNKLQDDCLKMHEKITYKPRTIGMVAACIAALFAAILLPSIILKGIGVAICSLMGLVVYRKYEKSRYAEVEWALRTDVFCKNIQENNLHPTVNDILAVYNKFENEVPSWNSQVTSRYSLLPNTESALDSFKDCVRGFLRFDF